MRIFVAVEISNEIRVRIRELIGVFQNQLGDRAVRWVKPENIHLTLKFIGEMPRERLPDLERVVEQALSAIEPFEFRVRGANCFPSFERPRVLVVGIDDPNAQLSQIQSSIERGAAEAGFARERRKFSPHLTLGRVRRRSAKAELEKISVTLREHRETEIGNELVSQISIIRSELTPRGPKYTALKTIYLGSIS